jgi:hypothetical protein
MPCVQPADDAVAHVIDELPQADTHQGEADGRHDRGVRERHDGEGGTGQHDQQPDPAGGGGSELRGQPGEPGQATLAPGWFGGPRELPGEPRISDRLGQAGQGLPLAIRQHDLVGFTHGRSSFCHCPTFRLLPRQEALDTRIGILREGCTRSAAGTRSAHRINPF